MIPYSWGLQYSLFSQWLIEQIDHILDHETDINKCKGIEIESAISDHNGTEPEINN